LEDILCRKYQKSAYINLMLSGIANRKRIDHYSCIKLRTAKGVRSWLGRSRALRQTLISCLRRQIGESLKPPIDTAGGKRKSAHCTYRSEQRGPMEMGARKLIDEAVRHEWFCRGKINPITVTTTSQSSWKHYKKKHDQVHSPTMHRSVPHYVLL
jgi:hypothetical protein